MATTRTRSAVWMHTKVCPRCGYHGWEIQSPESGDRAASPAETFECPSCGGDLYARPPRSYAEMEGLTASDSHGRAVHSVHAARSDSSRLTSLLRRIVGVIARLFGPRRAF